MSDDDDDDILHNNLNLQRITSIIFLKPYCNIQCFQDTAAEKGICRVTARLYCKSVRLCRQSAAYVMLGHSINEYLFD
jgi:hypothetical protein